MTDAPHIPWRQRWAILKRVASVIWRGDVLLYRVGVAAGIIPAPVEGKTMSITNAAESIFKAVLADKTWSQAAAMAEKADKALASGDLLVTVIKEHGKDVHHDVKLGLEAAQIIAPKIAAGLSSFLAGPAGGPALALFEFWLNGLLTGKPIQPGHPAYNAPAGNSNVTI